MIDLLLIALGAVVGMAAEAVTGIGKSLYNKATGSREKPQGGGGPAEE